MEQADETRFSRSMGREVGDGHCMDWETGASLGIWL
jgi:hypothetical protein